MELRPIFLFIFYLISCTNSVSIYNDELSEDEYVSRMARLPRSPSIWYLEEETKSPQQMNDISEEQQEGLRHENVIFISLAGNSERSKESSEEKRESSSLWSILSKTSALLASPFVKSFLSRTSPGDTDFSAQSNFANYIDYSKRIDFNPPPIYSDSVRNRLRNNELLVNDLRSDRRFVPI